VKKLGGVLFAVLAAIAFGATAPIAKMWLTSVSPLMASGLLYLSAGLFVGLIGLGRQRQVEAPLRGRDYRWLVGAILCGGVAAPWLLLMGLAQTSATAVSLLLNAELLLTVAVAAILFRDQVGVRAGFAAVLVAIGGLALSFDRVQLPTVTSHFGMLFVLAACLGWALDNNMIQRISLRDPLAITTWKGLSAGTISLGIAALTGNFKIPSPTTLVAAFCIGGIGYGASIVCYTYAQRALAASRAAAWFGIAPFIGALLAIGMGDPFTWQVGLAGLAMAGGAVCLLADRHSHPHVHEPLLHEHRHVHDEHHQHVHAGEEGVEPHSHLHRHERLVHDHAHAPDVHHRHEHELRG
jgi:drug/metabolite transporter (DMT)-like permease